jgi:hypothetical protein
VAKALELKVQSVATLDDVLAKNAQRLKLKLAVQ